ncbi:MAG: DNA-binding response regulator, partial [Nitriliruptorales bacterium]|nr:DNA-binding response regulator [Nitriliruptorales bacterium]
REMEVLTLVAQGMNNRDIAKALFISENTVKNHVRNILEKLHLHSRMEAVVYAVREKLLEIK